MSLFINHNIEGYHHKAIRSFSDSSSFLSSGVAKGHSTTEFFWLADLLFKQTGNTSINSNVAYIDFVSDRDIFYQEYGGVFELYDQYPVFQLLGKEYSIKKSCRT